MGEQAKDEDEACGPALTVESRDIIRSRRKREVRAKSISVKRMSKTELRLGELLYPKDEFEDVERPKTRADCIDAPRPCPFVSCRHHLYLDVSARTGSIKLNFPDLEVHEMKESCVLDIAERHGETLEGTGEILNLTRERVRQVEVGALAKLKAERDMYILRDFIDVGPVGKRRLPVLEEPEEEDEEEEPCGDEHADADTSFDVEHFASDELDAE